MEIEMKLASGKMTALIAPIVIAASAAMMPSAANAADYCLNSATGGSSCSFNTMEQCMASASGRDYFCTHFIDWNAWYASHGMSGPSDSYASYPRSGRRKPVAPPVPSDFPTRGIGSF
jgi:Protein of unknown function (DUF3551)